MVVQNIFTTCKCPFQGESLQKKEGSQFTCIQELSIVDKYDIIRAVYTKVQDQDPHRENFEIGQ